MPDRILTTHVGSLVRPPRVMSYIEAIEGGVAVDSQAYDACLREEIANVVRLQAEAGIDIVSDGEFGKLRSWSFYVLDRLTGIEERDVDAPRGAGRDQTLFPEFYAEYFPTQKLPKRGTAVAVAPITYKGHAAVARDIAIFKDGLEASGAKVEGAFLPVVAPASAVPRSRNEYYSSDEEFLFALAAALREEYKAIVDAGLYMQVDDAFLPYMYDVAFAGKDLAGYRKWAEVRIDALNHALEGLPEEKVRYHIWGQLQHAACQRRGAEGHRRSGAEGEGRRLLHRDGQPTPRARMARVGGETSQRPQARARRDQPLHQRGRAPRTGGRANRARRETGRAGERHGRHRLRFRADAARAPRAPLDHVGEAVVAGRGCAHGLKAAIQLRVGRRPSSVPNRASVR